MKKLKKTKQVKKEKKDLVDPVNLELSELNARERFASDYPELNILKVKTVYEGDGLYETYITIEEQTVSYGNSY